MAAKELELDISVMSLTVDNKSDQSIYSSEFRSQGGGWKLRYDKWRTVYGLYLRKCSGVAPNPLYVSVRVESSVDGRIVNVRPEVTRFTTHFEKGDKWFLIWQKTEGDILEALPEFRLIVGLKLEDSESKASQTEWSAAKAKSTSIQTTLHMNVLPCLESLSKDLDQLMVEGSYHDVEFQCAGHSTKAHKSIVCKRSPVIASMLSTDMVEGRTGVVVIPDMEPDIFTKFMRYIYCGQLEELTFNTALRLYEAGDQYEVLGLAKRCSEFLLDHLSVDNAYEVLVTADAHNNKECVEKVIDYMVESRVPLVSEEWSAFCDEHYKLAIKVLNRGWKVFAK